MSRRAGDRGEEPDLSPTIQAEADKTKEEEKCDAETRRKGVFSIVYLTLLRWEIVRAGVCTRSGHLMKKTMHIPTASHTPPILAKIHAHTIAALYDSMLMWLGRKGEGAGARQAPGIPTDLGCATPDEGSTIACSDSTALETGGRAGETGVLRLQKGIGSDNVCQPERVSESFRCMGTCSVSCLAARKAGSL